MAGQYRPEQVLFRVCMWILQVGGVTDAHGRATGITINPGQNREDRDGGLPPITIFKRKVLTLEKKCHSGFFFLFPRWNQCEWFSTLQSFPSGRSAQSGEQTCKPL